MANWAPTKLIVTGLTDDQRIELTSKLQCEDDFFLHYITEPDWDQIPNDQGELPVNGVFQSTDKCDSRSHEWCDIRIGPRITNIEILYSKDARLEAYFLSKWSMPFMGFLQVSGFYPKATFELFTFETAENFGNIAAIRNLSWVEKEGTAPSDLPVKILSEEVTKFTEDVEQAREKEDDGRLLNLMFQHEQMIDKGYMASFLEHHSELMVEAKADLDRSAGVSLKDILIESCRNWHINSQLVGVPLDKSLFAQILKPDPAWS